MEDNGARSSSRLPADDVVRTARRAVESRITELEEGIADASALLDRLPFGILLLDARGRFLRSNLRAQHLLRERDGLSVALDELQAARPEDTAKLRRLVAGAARGERGDTVLVLRRPSGRRPLQVFIEPAHGNHAPCWHVRPSAVVVLIADPDHPLSPAIADVRSAYGLTAAQARVAVLLGEGLSLGAIAERLQVRVDTVRAHLKKVFAKTATRRQSELVRLLLHGALALEAGGRE